MDVVSSIPGSSDGEMPSNNSRNPFSPVCPAVEWLRGLPGGPSDEMWYPDRDASHPGKLPHTHVSQPRKKCRPSDKIQPEAPWLLQAGYIKK